MPIIDSIKRAPKIFGLYKNPLVYYRDKLSKDRKKVYPIQLRNGLQFRIHSGNSDINTINEVFSTDGYRRVLDCITPTSVVVDIGANIGIFSIAAAQKAEGGKVYSFEPNKEVLPLLDENINLNKKRELIFVHPLAIATKKEPRELYFEPHNWGGASLLKDELSGKELITLQVQCITMADIFHLMPGGRIDILKIDCEGAELEILSGLDSAMCKKINILFVEYHEPRTSAEELENILRQLGFTVTHAKDMPALYARRSVFNEAAFL